MLTLFAGNPPICLETSQLKTEMQFFFALNTVE